MNIQGEINHRATIEIVAKFLIATMCALFGTAALAAESCERTVTANVVAMDQPVLFNRLGASNVNGMIYALARDVVAINAVPIGTETVPIDATIDAATLKANAGAFAGNVGLRRDKRPRPLVLRIREGDCLTVEFTNLLTPLANPFNVIGAPITVQINDQVKDRHASFHVAGLQWLNGPEDDGTYVGMNATPAAVPDQGQSATYELYAPEEGVFIVRGMGTTVGSDANQGNSSNLLFGQVIVEPRQARIYRGQLTDEEMRLASMKSLEPGNANCGVPNLTDHGQPIINYEATYPAVSCDGPDGVGTGNNLGGDIWFAEGKAGLPILNMITAGDEIVHSEINGLIVGPDADGTWTSACVGGTVMAPNSDCPYPLESVGKRNPVLPNRLEPFRDFASIFHDEPATAQAFPGFYNHEVFGYVLAGVKDGFMINYGSGGIGSEIIANRLGVGPMHDCLTCAYEEFFLTSFTVGDPALLTDIAANMGLELLEPGEDAPAGAVGPKATYVAYPDDPSNVHHSYTGDFAKFRNTHVGNEQHVFHLHNHQWLYNPNDDNSNYLDAQGIGPGIGYTYEINFGGSGNRMKSTGDSIFHCHFYPHFAQGMWAHWRHHDVLETGTPLQVSGALDGFHNTPWALEVGMPLDLGLDVDGVPIGRARALPDGEIVAGTPIPAIVPLPGKAMPPMPGKVVVVPNPLKTAASFFHPDNIYGAPDFMVPVGSLAKVVDRDIHPGYPFWVAGIEDTVGQRPPTPPLDMISAALATALSADNPTCVDGSAIDVDGRCADGSLPKSPILKTVRRPAGPDELAPVLVSVVPALFDLLDPAQAAGHDGGLPRTALQGVAAGGAAHSVISPIDFSKELVKAQAVFFPEDGTDIEQLSMAYHAVRNHPSFAVNMDGSDPFTANFVLNGIRPAVGAPYHEPCMDDEGERFATDSSPVGEGGYNFWGSDPDKYLNIELTEYETRFDASNPRIYQGVNIQFDAVLNKAGYHYPQQRIITLWEDAVPVITKAKAPEPMVLRFNSFECGVYHHSNLVPEYYEVDDYQVRTPTDIIGQHIHLPKWDLTTADGSANGWNYEDGTLSPGAVQERIHALNEFIQPLAPGVCADGTTADSAGICANGAPAGKTAHRIATGAMGMDFQIDTLWEFANGTAEAAAHPYFSTQMTPGTLQEKWMGARTTTQRWFFDPVVNSDDVDRGLGLIFTHDHYGPSTHQQVGLYATVLTEPSRSTWYQNETEEQLGCATPGERPEGYGVTGGCRKDGGPTSWQAVIVPDPAGSIFNPANQLVPHREFYFEYSDFQHAYEAGVYVGAGQWGEALAGAGADAPMAVEAHAGMAAVCGTDASAFRCAINPPARLEIVDKTKIFPDLYEEIATTTVHGGEQFCTVRPCPQAIDVQDPGMFAVNYRNEPIALRVYDPNKLGPDLELGTQADGAAGDLAFALASVDHESNPIIRKFEVGDFGGASTLPPINPDTGGYQVLNIQPKAGTSIYGTVFPPPINEFAALKGGDPFTPMARTMSGDKVRFKIQAGGDEEEHVATVHGIKWLQGGSAFGGAPNSGWRNAQPAGISEQFTLTSPVFGVVGERGNSTDMVYTMDASQDGYWSGMWGLMRVYGNRQNDLMILPSQNPDQDDGWISAFETTNNVSIDRDGFDGVCPAVTTGKGKNKSTAPANLRSYDITAVLANDILGGTAGGDPHDTGHVGGSPNPAGGTLVYNSRAGGNTGSALHDPTAILYVRTEDMMDANDPQQRLKPGVPVEPLILRANAGDCIEVTLRNRLLVSATAGGQPVIYADGRAVFLDDGNNNYLDMNGDGVGDDTELVDKLDIVFDEMPELATYNTLLGANKRDRGAGTIGSTTFQTNLIQASPYVGMHAQLVEFDSSRHNGIHAGNKSSATNLAAPGDDVTYKWYAGDLRPTVTLDKRGRAKFVIQATAVELGTSNLQPADVIKQGMKSMVGQLVIEPPGATWPEDDRDGSTDTSTPASSGGLEDRAGIDPNGSGHKTRAMVTVTAPNPDGSTGSYQFRDLSTVWAKGLTQYYATGNEPVPHINGENVGIPEDPQDGTGMAINYGTEPSWHRLGIAPNAPFGPAGYGGVDPQFDLFANGRVGGDPQTPVFTAPAGMETRMRVAIPHGTNRGSTFALHGHMWQRDPYITQNEVNGFPNSLATGGPGLGSIRIGHNPLGFYMGGLESIWPSTHYDVRLPSAGGCANKDVDELCVGKPGDYLFRDFSAGGNAAGLWGILRVE